MMSRCTVKACNSSLMAHHCPQTGYKCHTPCGNSGSVTSNSRITNMTRHISLLARVCIAVRRDVIAIPFWREWNLFSLSREFSFRERSLFLARAPIGPCHEKGRWEETSTCESSCVSGDLPSTGRQPIK